METESIQRKRRFILYFILTLALSASTFYAGYEIGKIQGKKEIIDRALDKKEEILSLWRE